MLTRIQDIITTELDHQLKMVAAENMRAAAWYVMEEFPDATSTDFADAAVMLGLHRQGAINRWNEAVKNLKAAG